MDKIITRVFFGAGLLAYAVFFANRAQAFVSPDYSQDAVILLLLGILAHFAFDRRAGGAS
jgi:hypothetical protein